MRRTRLLLSVLLVLLAASVALLAAGLARRGAARAAPADASGGEAVPKGPDLTSAATVLVEAQAALGRSDLAALRALCTEEGFARLLRDVEAWRTVLSDPATGPRVAARLPVGDEAARDALRRALSGSDPGAALALLVQAQGRGAWTPVPDAGPPAGSDRWEAEVSGPGGERRRVLLLRAGQAWRVHRLDL